MSTPINLPDTQLNLLFQKISETSAIEQVAEVVKTSSQNNQIVHTLTSGDARYHVHGGANKTFNDEVMTPVVITMATEYKLLKFYDTQFDDNKSILDAIINKLPVELGMTHDKASFGTDAIATSPFPGYTEAALPVDGTAASWTAVIDAIVADGYNPTAAILNTTMKSLVRVAATEGSNVNPLNVNVQDGFQIAGVTCYFRNLGAGIKGVIGDFTQMVSAHYDKITIEIHRPENDITLRQENAVAVYAGIRRGIGIVDQKAFRKLS